MARLNELETSLLQRLSAEVEKYQFDKRVRGQDFYRKTPFGRLAFHLSFIKHSGDMDVTADVALRFDRLEDLVNEHKPFLPKAAWRGTFSLGAELGNIKGVGQKRWTVATLDDIDAVAPSIMNDFASIGIPFLEKYSDMETALQALKGDDAEGRLLSPFNNERAMSAIGLAFLLGDRERFTRIAKAKREFLTSMNDIGLPDYLEMQAALERKLAASSALTG